jgi:hypothetical protein
VPETAEVAGRLTRRVPIQMVRKASPHVVRCYDGPAVRPPIRDDFWATEKAHRRALTSTRVGVDLAFS